MESAPVQPLGPAADDIDEDSFEDSEEEFDDTDTITAAPMSSGGYTSFTFNPLPAQAELTPHERKLQLAAIALQYGVPPNKDAQLRFVVGLRENNKPPGKRPGEIDKFRRSWRSLIEFSRGANWRRILSNDFDQIRRRQIGKPKRGENKSLARPGDGPFPFKIDGFEWKSVIHFMIGMLYSRDPDYAILYSMQSAENPNAFWGSVEAAKREHQRNILYGEYEPDPDFEQKASGYLAQAMLAKFTQNPIAKQALLLTEDAIISIRGGPEGILDVPEFAQVRNYIRENPKAIYLGANVAMEQEVEEIPTILNVEELNYGYVGPDGDRTGLVAGSIPKTALYPSTKLKDVMTQHGLRGFLEQEDLTVSECYVYLLVGALDLDVNKLIAAYGQAKYVRRTIYALEKVADNAKNRIMVAVQRTPTSYQSEYILIQTQIGDGGPISIYLEPLGDGFGIFMVTGEKNQRYLDFLQYLINISGFHAPVAEP